MSEVSERYGRLAEGFAATVQAVPTDRWASPSPCEGWTAREVVRHVVDTQGMFLGFVGRVLGDIPSVDNDPAGAWEAARRMVQSDLDDPVRATAEFDGHFGRSTFEAAVGRFLCLDLIVHRWDLARAAGIDHRIEPGDLRWADEVAHAFGDAMRGPGAFGPELDTPDGADEQARLLAFLGRRA